MKKHLTILFLFLTQTMFGADTLIAPLVNPRLQFFSLHDVRLLPSPFKHIEDLNHQYLLQLEPDRLASWFRREAGLTPKAPPYPSWESEPVGSVGALPGHIMGFYLSSMSMMYAATGDEAIKEKLRYTLTELKACQEANGSGYLLPTIGGKHLFEDVAAGNFTTKNPTINDVFEPTYVMNKIMLGLYSVYTNCHLPEAKGLDQRMADWFGHSVLDKLNHEQVQKLLFCEHGSLNESFVQVYEMTGDKKYLAWAKRLTDEMVFLPLSQNKVEFLNGQHANTNIPKFTGYQNVYDYNGEKAYADAAQNFWNTVALNRSWANGGNSMHEHFFPPQEFEKKLPETGGPESCNSVNMMRLTERLFQDAPSPAMMDYYEGVLYNHILANYNPENGQCVYYTSMRPGSYKVYGLPNQTFWCCSGTGLEAPAKFGQAIYAHDADKLFVNLFIPSTVDWKEQGVRLTQQTSFPDSETSSFTMNTSSPKTFSLLVRRPSWLAKAMMVTVNGKKVNFENNVEGYVSINRVWKDGDVVKATLPMQVKSEALPYSDKYFSFHYGPILMASKVDNHGLVKADFNQQRTTVQTKIIPVAEAPALVGNAKPEAGFVRAKGEALSFTNASQNLELLPFNSIHFNRYAVYFRRYNDAAAYEADKKVTTREKAALANVDTTTVDRVKVGDSISERQHRFEGVSTNSGGGIDKWRDASKGGYFMYQMKLPKSGQPKLYILFNAGDEGDRMFDVLVDGRLLQSFDHRKKVEGKTGLYPVTISLPDEMVKGKESITVKFAARNRNTAGGVFDVRVLE